MEPLSASRPMQLASGSPRRREILENLRLPFVVAAAPVDESTAVGESAATYMERVVGLKLGAAAGAGPANVAAILVADTSVIVDGAIVGKPGSTAEAEAMIARLAGRTHEVWTRFSLGAPNDAAGGSTGRSEGATPDAVATKARVLHAETVVTRVTFRPLTAERVRAYAASGEGMDKAGAYAVQGLGASLVRRIEGSYSNVVGLPACELMQALEGLGLLP